MPQTNRRVSMRLRRLITLSVAGVLVVGLAGAFGLPSVISDQAAKLPESVQNIANQVQPKPVTIFDPPKYSIDEADSIWVVVNKQRQISPLRYTPTNLVFPNFPKPKIQNPFSLQLRQEAAVATIAMAKAMKDEGAGTLILNSGFRTYKTQQALYNRTRDARGLAVAEKLSARPGHSEHQLGLAADFSTRGQGCVILVCFGNTEAGIWLAENAHQFGFVLRYPKGYKRITGFQYEPWHFRYVGVELATEMKTKGIKTLEEFWDMGSAPGYLSEASPPAG
jgi:D-alanyl-D-alanine carboxypeptidase